MSGQLRDLNFAISQADPEGVHRGVQRAQKEQAYSVQRDSFRS